MSAGALATLRKENHLSVSAINTYLRCPSAYFYRYILQIQETFRPGALAFGTAIHVALAYFYSALMKGEDEPPVEKLASVFTDSWKEQLRGDLPVLLNGKQTYDDLQDMGVAMLTCFHQEVPRPHRVVGVEEPFCIEVCHPSSDEPVGGERLVGVFDAVIQNEDDSYTILEHKTAARRYSKTRLEHDLQVTAYHHAARFMGLGNAVVTLQVLLKSDMSALELHTPRRSNRDIMDYQRIASGVHAAIDAGAFYPVQEFSCTWCSHASSCLAG